VPGSMSITPKRVPYSMPKHRISGRTGYRRGVRFLGEDESCMFRKAPIASAPNASCMDTLAPTARAVLREPEEARDVGERRTVHRDFWAVSSGDNKSTSKEAAESSVRLARGRTLKRWFRK
jgi:hypothetical protein